MSIKLVVFDMAGTTVEDNQNVAQALQLALREFGYAVPLADINQVMGYAKPVAIRSLLGTYGKPGAAYDEALVAAVHDRFVQEITTYYEVSADIREKQGASEVFRQLRDTGIKVALDTGFSRDIADVIFGRLGWRQGRDYDVSITSDEVLNGRPYPDMIFRAMELLHVGSVLEVAKVGDTHSDLQEGTAAGCKYVIGITTGAYTEEELGKERHTHLVRNLNEVLDIVVMGAPALN